MANRSHPLTVGARVNRREKGILQAAANAESVSVSTFIRRTTLPAARERVARELKAVENAEISVQGITTGEK